MTQTNYGKLTGYAKKALVAYAIVGSLALIGNGNTGHQSADIYLGISKPTKIEKAMYKPFFQKLDIESKIFNEK